MITLISFVLKASVFRMKYQWILNFLANRQTYLSQSRVTYNSSNDIGDMINQIYNLNFMFFKQKHTKLFIEGWHFCNRCLFCCTLVQFSSSFSMMKIDNIHCYSVACWNWSLASWTWTLATIFEAGNLNEKYFNLFESNINKTKYIPIIT